MIGIGVRVRVRVRVRVNHNKSSRKTMGGSQGKLHSGSEQVISRLIRELDNG